MGAEVGISGEEIFKHAVSSFVADEASFRAKLTSAPRWRRYSILHERREELELNIGKYGPRFLPAVFEALDKIGAEKLERQIVPAAA